MEISPPRRSLVLLLSEVRPDSTAVSHVRNCGILRVTASCCRMLVLGGERGS